MQGAWLKNEQGNFRKSSLHHLPKSLKPDAPGKVYGPMILKYLVPSCRQCHYTPSKVAELPGPQFDSSGSLAPQRCLPHDRLQNLDVGKNGTIILRCCHGVMNVCFTSIFNVMEHKNGRQMKIIVPLGVRRNMQMSGVICF